jgi:hypothetical protein
MEGMPLSKELREGVPQVQRLLIHSIIEFSAMTMQQLLERKRQNEAELAELKRSNPWMAALEEEQAKANASRERIAEVRVIQFCNLALLRSNLERCVQCSCTVATRACTLRGLSESGGKPWFLHSLVLPS